MKNKATRLIAKKTSSATEPQAALTAAGRQRPAATTANPNEADTTQHSKQAEPDGSEITPGAPEQIQYILDEKEGNQDENDENFDTENLFNTPQNKSPETSRP